jgi:nucleotide-binding universal stress UspA family protein
VSGGNWVLAATDLSSDGRHAVVTAGMLADRLQASLAVLEVLGAGPLAPPGGRAPAAWHPGGQQSVAEGRLRDWLEADRQTRGFASSASIVVARGVPGVEISRFGNTLRPALIVLGRRQRTPEQPRLLGETADAVVRRSECPVLFVPAKVTRIERVLVALDRSERAHRVLECGRRFARTMGAELSAVTVQQTRYVLAGQDDAAARAVLPPRAPLRSDLAITRLSEDNNTTSRIEIRTGDPIEQVLACISVVQPDLLVIGYRRGGPPKVFGPAEIARNLLYAAPCGVLTVPL